MGKAFFIAWIAVFVVWMAGDFVVHGMVLHDDYARLGSLFRSDADSQRYMPWMVLAHAVMAGALVWIYSRGVEATGWAGQGIRFGIAVALLAVVPSYMIYYAVQPMPGDVVAKQIVLETIVVVIVGLVTAALYRAPARA
jgi:hypothetical protein